ncbi:MAG TPA: CoA transferase [Solirubrobacterales bacterium]|nr:CoA transferase [Solirubrobacterales bacterium]
MLLDGLTVVLAGDARPLRFAARALSDLGARTYAASAAGAAASQGDELDDLWLGVPEPWSGGGGRSADIVLAERGADLGSLAAGATVVRYGAVGATAPRAGDQLSEREATAAGGVAIALGDPERPPLPLPDGCVDAFAGTHLAAAALAALLDGVAATDVAAADALAALVAVNEKLCLPYGAPWFRSGRRASGSGGCYPYALFEAADGLFCMIGRTDRDWAALLSAMGDPAWARGEGFDDPRVVARLYADMADAWVGAWVGEHSREELIAILTPLDFACAPVLRPDEVLELPALADRWRAATAGDGTAVRVAGAPFDVEPAAAEAEPLDGAPFVLDLSWIWSGPAVSVGLADLGATVVKVESAARPDNTRLRGAPLGFEPDPQAPRDELSRYFQVLNRGKRSVELDLKTEAGPARLQQLAARADVIVENLSPGVMDRWGVAPAAVHEHNPGCVYVSMRGYRPHPSTAGLRAYAPALSSSAGLEQLVGYPGEAPLGAMSVAFSDGLAAATGQMLVLAGLWHRRRTGAGAAITLSQHETALLANGRNVVADQLGRLGSGLEPLSDESHVVGDEELPRSPWVSADLFGSVRPRWLGEVRAARLPWRREGELPPLTGPAPELGADSDAILAG